MSKLNEAGINELIERYKKTYTDNPSILISGYNQEKQTVADYNGRQILELMQNADDAKSDIIKIELDTENSLLTVSNNGESFSLDGIESLMYTGISTKNKTEYIGNKGLGFRSILNWVNQVSIKTKEINLRFSRKYSEDFFDEVLYPVKKIQERIEKDITEKKILQGEKPIAALAFPKVSENQKSDFITSIILHFKEYYLDQLKEQLNNLTEQTLLFLPNIREIIIEENGILITKLIKTLDKENEVMINDSRWNVFRVSEQEYHNLKFKFAIAWKDNLDLQGLFYNYFPTEVETDLPSIIHATFDLTSNRKEINDNEANKYILNQIAKNLGEIANRYLKKEKSDWYAYHFLTPTSYNKRKVLSDFYLQIKAEKETISCYPTVDNQYIKLNESVYHGEEFSKWVEKNSFGQYFPKLLKATEGLPIQLNNRYTENEFHQCIININHLLTMEQRVQLVGILVRNHEKYFERINQGTTKLPLLLNSKNEIVDPAILVFTKDTDSKPFQLPDFIEDITFISQELYGLIRKELQDEIAEKKLDTESGDSRAIKRLLNTIVNIGSDDVTDVIQHIISETNMNIQSSNTPQKVIKQMIVSLYSVFNSNKNRRGNLTNIKNIPLLTRSGIIRKSDILYFGKEYNLGIDAEKIFDEIRISEQYIAGNEIWQLEGNQENIVKFFTWLNVNLYSKFEILERKLGRWENNSYTDLIINKISDQKRDVYKSYKVDTIFEIENILKQPQFSIEKLIAWIAKDESFFQKLKRNSDEFIIEFGRDSKEITEKASYISHLISQSGITKNVILTLPFGEIENLKPVDINHILFQDLQIQEYKIKEIVDLLHIKSSFFELNPDHIYQILKNYNSENNSQTIYKTIYEYFRENESTQLKDYVPDFKDLQYFCRKGGIGKEISLQQVDQVFYSDNKLLPQKILDQYWFINLPKRIGENRVKSFFGVNLIKDLLTDIIIHIEKENILTETFNQYLNKLKPYFLSYRLQSLNRESDKKEAARNIKHFHVQLIKKGYYETKGSNKTAFERLDFIPNENDFIIQFDIDNKIELLQSDRDFCDAVAEMVCIVFKIGDFKNTFRRIFKDGPAESYHIIQSDEKESLLEEAKKLLGISLDEQNFWNKVLSKNNLLAEDEKTFISEIEKNLDTLLPDFYKKVDFSNLGNKEGIEFLGWLTDQYPVSLHDIISEKTLKNWHKEQLDHVIKNHLRKFEKLLWMSVNHTGSIEQKEYFFRNIIKYENSVSENLFVDFIYENKFELFPDYNNAIDQFVYLKYGFRLSDSIPENIKVQTLYRQILSIYSFGDSLEDMEKIIESDNPSVYSLMYFEGFDERIKNECEKQQTEKTHDISGESDSDENGEQVFHIIESCFTKNVMLSSRPSGKEKGSYTSKGGRKKAAFGKMAEEKVKKALISQGYLVNHISTRTDHKHYDLEYKKEGDIEWRYLEIKKDSGGYFFLSKEQKETALSSAMNDKYDIAIVDNDTIHIIKSPFKFKDETFEHNSRFYAEPVEYKINFKVNELKNN